MPPVKRIYDANIQVTGVFYLDSAIVVAYPVCRLVIRSFIRAVIISKAIANLWKQRLFSNVEIYVTRVDGDFIDLEIHVMEDQDSNYDFKGIKIRGRRIS
jgi:outer membrane protein insertion porin family